MIGRRPPDDRRLHPGAWWLWGIGLATAAAHATNPLVLALIVGVVSLVVAARRTPGPWARAFRFYLLAGGFVILMRVGFRIAFGGGFGSTVVFTLPSLPLPDWAAGITLGGPVTAEALAAGAYDGARLATMLVCVGAINALANPRRLLRSLPKALFEVGTALVVAVNLAPQLVDSVQRVRRARRLRGGQTRGLRSLRAIAVPVFEDAMARSIALAASMDARGFGRTTEVSGATRRTISWLMLSGLAGICLGLYAVFDGTLGGPPAITVLGGGIALACAGMVLGGRRIERTRHGADRWGGPEWLVVASAAAAAAVFLAGPQGGLIGSVDPVRWPTLPVLPTLALLVAVTPAWSAPARPRVFREAELAL